jgi:hypothetical protein
MSGPACSAVLIIGLGAFVIGRRDERACMPGIA